MRDIYAKLAELMEVDALKPDDVLKSFSQWDSLTMLSVLAMADSEFGLHLTAQNLIDAKTVADLVKLFDSRNNS